MGKKPKDRTDILEDENSKLKKTIRRRDKTIRQLRSDAKTAEEAFRRTETYLKEVTDGKPLSEILRTVESNKPLSPIKKSCPKCNSRDMKKIIFTGFYVISCKCGYRNRVDEKQEIEKDKEG